MLKNRLTDSSFTPQYTAIILLQFFFSFWTKSKIENKIKDYCLVKHINPNVRGVSFLLVNSIVLFKESDSRLTVFLKKSVASSLPSVNHEITYAYL